MRPDNNDLALSVRASDLRFEIPARRSRNPIRLPLHTVSCFGQNGLDIIRRRVQLPWTAKEIPLANLIGQLSHVITKLDSKSAESVVCRRKWASIHPAGQADRIPSGKKPVEG
jgi:hypothetical protein